MADTVAACSDNQAAALWQARLHINEDGDNAGIRIVDASHTIRIDQWTPSGTYVRTWIATPDGQLTWR